MKKSRNIGGRRKGKDPQTRIQRDEVPTRLPALKDQLAVGMVLRFQSTLNFTGSTSVTFQNLLDAWFFAGTATTAYNLFDFVKVKKVVIRATNSLATSGGGVVSVPMANVGIEFPNIGAGMSGSGKQAQDSSMGTNSVAMVSLSPDPKSQAAQYQYSSANVAFVVRAKEYSGAPLAGVVVDVHCVFKNSADVNPAGNAYAVAGATPGLIYFGGMDGKRLATTEWRTAFTPAL